jgi:hypothetical protein
VGCKGGRYSEILKLKFVSPIDSENFNHCSTNFPSISHESSLQSCGQCFDSLRLKAELSVIHSSEELLRSIISGVLRYLIVSYWSTAFSEVTKLSAFLLTVPVTSASVEGLLF